MLAIDRNGEGLQTLLNECEKKREESSSSDEKTPSYQYKLHILQTELTGAHVADKGMIRTCVHMYCVCATERVIGNGNGNVCVPGLCFLCVPVCASLCAHVFNLRFLLRFCMLARHLNPWTMCVCVSVVKDSVSLLGGRIDVWVNNAGIAVSGSVVADSCTEERLRTLIDVNFMSPVFLTRFAITIHLFYYN